MHTIHILRRGWRSFWREERGVMMAIVLVIMTLLMGAGATAIYSGYTNLQTANNLKLSSRAKAQAEANVNEAIFRLSRQETDPDVITGDLSDATWEVEIHFTSGDTDASDGTLSTIQAATDWPAYVPAEPVVIRFKRPDIAGDPNGVLFYDPDDTDADGNLFETMDLPGTIPDSWHPVYQIMATAQDDRDAERQILAEVVESTTFAPEAPLSSGVDVNLNGSGFIDGVNHHHMIYITDGGGAGAMYGDGSSETTDTPNAGTIKDSPDDVVNEGGGAYFVTYKAYPVGEIGDTYEVYPAGGGGGGGGCNTGKANVPLTATASETESSCARLFNKRISSTDFTPAWIGLTWISDPTATGCTALGHTATPHWHGSNTGYASAIALSNNGAGGPTVTNDQPPTSNVWTKGVFSWRVNNDTTSLTGDIPAAGTFTNCSPGGTPKLVCRPTALTHTADSFSNSQHFPFFQEFLGMNDADYQNLLANPDTTEADLDAGDPPLGFTYINGDYTFNNSTTSPGTNDFGLLYVTGDLTINGNQTYKGVIFIDGTLTVTGNPTILGALLVRGTTEITAGTGNMTLLYSRKAAELGIQAGHPWRTLSWADTAMQ